MARDISRSAAPAARAKPGRLGASCVEWTGRPTCITQAHATDNEPSPACHSVATRRVTRRRRWHSERQSRWAFLRRDPGFGGGVKTKPTAASQALVALREVLRERAAAKIRSIPSDAWCLPPVVGGVAQTLDCATKPQLPENSDLRVADQYCSIRLLRNSFAQP